MTLEAEDSIKKAATIIAAGGLVAVPTETVYGLAADAANDEAVARIFEAKERPQFNPLIIHVADPAMAKRYAEFTPLAEKLADAFGWHGHYIRDAADLEGALETAFNESGPSLVVIPIDYRENNLLTKKLGELQWEG